MRTNERCKKKSSLALNSFGISHLLAGCPQLNRKTRNYEVNYSINMLQSWRAVSLNIKRRRATINAYNLFLLLKNCLAKVSCASSYTEKPFPLVLNITQMRKQGKVFHRPSHCALNCSLRSPPPLPHLLVPFCTIKNFKHPKHY